MNIIDKDTGMERDEALKLVKKHVNNKNLIKHMLAVEAVMGKLAEHFGENVEEWRLAGLVHDLDYNETVDRPETHGLISAGILEESGLSEEIVKAVKAHNPALGFERKSLMEKALYCADPVTGLIVASALIHPEKKLGAIDADFVMKRFGEKHFARGADRDQIRASSELGLELHEFLDLSVKAMQEIAHDIGL